MRLVVLTAFCVAGLVLRSAGADAETWTVLSGKLIKGGAAHSLSGSFSGFVSSADSPGESDLLGIDDFSLVAGRRTLEPDAPVEYQGLAAAGWLSAGDQIQIEEDRVTLLHLRAGGERVGAGLGYATFRFLELRADASHGGVVQGHFPDSDAPVRLSLKGDVYQVEQSFRTPGLACSPPIGTPAPGGGAAGGSVLISSGSSFGRRNFVWVGSPGAGAGLVMRRAAQPIAAAWLAYNSSFAGPPLSLPPAPTLEQIGIRAPEGAEITFDAGTLEVRSTGDLFVEGTLSEVEVPGLTNVTLTTPKRILVTGRIVVSGSISVNAGEYRLDGGEIDAGDPASQPPACRTLTPILPAQERVIGRFTLVASAARQIRIDVMPGDNRNRVLANAPRAPLAVAILGSRTLDVADVDADTLRLGAGEAEPFRHDMTPFPTSSPYRMTPAVVRVNRDRFSDLLGLYPVQDAEIALGDRELCLVAQTYQGELLEGCDRIDTGFGVPAGR